MTPNEFLDIIDSITETIKKRASKYSKDNNREFYPMYNQFVHKYERAKIQANAEFPESLFQAIAPLQSPEELKYIREIYESETQDVFNEFSNTVKKAVTNGVIEFPATQDKEESNKLKDYLDNQIKDFDNFQDWLSAMVDHKIIDANGIVCVWPERLEVDEEGNIIGEIFPQPIIYASPSIVWKKEDEFIVLTSRKSTVNSYGKDVPEGMVFRYIGKESYMQAEQIGKKVDETYEVTFEFKHEIKGVNGQPFTPAIYFKGEAVIKEDSVYYKSTYDAAVSHLNLATLHASSELIILRKVGYPTRVLKQSVCKHQENGATCDNGTLRVSDGEKIDIIQCPNCKGSGYNQPGIMRDMIIEDDQKFDEQKSNLNANNSLAYISPSIEIPKFLVELVEKKVARAKEVLHLRSEPRGSGDITATEKDRDKENTEAFIRPISDQIWSIAELVIECIGRLTAPDQYDKIKPQIIRPTTFDLASSEDYVKAISEARESNLPEVIIQDMVYRYMSKVHKNSSLSMQIYELIEASDRLVAVNSADIAIGLSRGTIEKWESILHSSVFYIIDKLIREDNNFLTLDVSGQVEQIQSAAKVLVPVQTANLPPAVEP